MTNIEYLQSLGKEKAVEFIGEFCPKHDRRGSCKGCAHEHDNDFCNAYTLGIDALGNWLLDEHDDNTEADNG